MPRKFLRTAVRVEEVPSGSTRGVVVAGQAVLLCNVAGTIHAAENSCPHMGAELSDGELRGPVIVCAWHGWQFDVTTGQCVHFAQPNLVTYPVAVADGEVLVGLPSVQVREQGA